MCLIDFFLFLLNSKISAHEFERGGLLKPIVNTIDGTPTFLSVCPQNDSALCSVSSNIGSTNNNSHRPQRLSRNELRHLDEKQLIFELVRYRMLYNILFNIFYTHAYTFYIRLVNNLYFISKLIFDFLTARIIIVRTALQVKDICNELDVRSLCHKILQNVSILLKADRGSLFLVQGKCNSASADTPNK